MINLRKGENTSLSKISGELKFRVGLSWDASNGGKAMDLDAIAIELNGKVGDGGKAISQNHCAAYFNGTDPTNPKLSDITFQLPNGGTGFQSIDKAIQLMGDSRDGAANGWDEELKIDFSKVDPAVKSIVIFVNIYDPDGTGLNFGQVRNSMVSVCPGDSDIAELCYEMSEDNSGSQCLRVCEFYKRTKPDGSVEWKMSALGEEGENSLEAELRKFGLPVE